MRHIVIYSILLITLLISCDKSEYFKKSTINNSISEDSTLTKVVILGSGTPNPDPNRAGSALAIIVNSEAYLVDCGVGIVRKANAAYRKGIKALKVDNLKTLFLTHLHSDHTMGLPDLILTPWVLGREEKLRVWGPKGTQRMVRNIEQAYSEDIRIRLSGLEPISPEGYKTNVIEFQQGLIYQDYNIDVYAYKVEHGDVDEAYAFQFITQDKVITVSGDCRPCEGIYEASLGCDILIHEVYSYVGFLTRSDDWQRYHKASHTSTIELAELANKVKPKMLVLYHILNWGASEENLIQEIKMEYDGEVICGKDLLIIE